MSTSKSIPKLVQAPTQLPSLSPKLVVRYANFEDYVGILKLQKEFFDSRGAEIQKRLTPTSWCVAVTEDNEIIGCYSYTDDRYYNIRGVQDFYVAKNRPGIRSVLLMWEHIERNAKADDRDISFVIEPYNLKWANALHKHGFSVVGIQFYKKVHDPEDSTIIHYP